MHLLWLKMYAPAGEEPSNTPLAADDLEEISGLIEESFPEGDDIETASAMLSSREQGPLASKTQLKRVAPSPTLSVDSRKEEPTLVDAPDLVPTRLGAQRNLRPAVSRKVARS